MFLVQIMKHTAGLTLTETSAIFENVQQVRLESKHMITTTIFYIPIIFLIVILIHMINIIITTILNIITIILIIIFLGNRATAVHAGRSDL